MMDEMSPVAQDSEMVSTPSRGPTAGRCEVEKKTGVTMTTGQTASVCSGCHTAILDPWIRRVGGSLYHEKCLTCRDCQSPLTESCHRLDQSLYCHTHFIRRVSTPCASCHVGISPTEQVMRAHQRFYHQQCFRCRTCDQQISTGDKFYVCFDGGLLCVPCSKEYFHNSVRNQEVSGTKGGMRSSCPQPSPRQEAALTEALQLCPIADDTAISQLALKLHLDKRVVEMWLQNKRTEQDLRLVNDLLSAALPQTSRGTPQDNTTAGRWPSVVTTSWAAAAGENRFNLDDVSLDDWSWPDAERRLSFTSSEDSDDEETESEGSETEADDSYLSEVSPATHPPQTTALNTDKCTLQTVDNLVSSQECSRTSACHT